MADTIVIIFGIIMIIVSLGVVACIAMFRGLLKVGDDAPGFLVVILMAIVLAVLGMITCSRSGTDAIPGLPTNIEIVRQMEETYTNLMTVDEFGFIDTSKCDSLLFTSLANVGADLTAAEPTPGQYVRRPVAYPDCFTGGMSRSDISRDMLLGVIYHSYLTSDLPRLLRLWNYGMAHNWIMSQHGGIHAIYGPGDTALLAQTIYVLSDGEHDYGARHAITPPVYNTAGYVQHLQSITVWLRREVYGGLLSGEIALIRRYADENPGNPLHQMVLGNYARAAEILITTYPRDRLPTTADWCEPWRIQRVDTDSGLTPCADRGMIHSGGDLLFVARHIK